MQREQYSMKRKLDKKTKEAEEKERETKSMENEERETLDPKPHVTVHKLDPFFETSGPVPFISMYAHSRLVFRAVKMKDHQLLKQLINDKCQVRLLDRFRGVTEQVSALHIAISEGDLDAVRLLARDFHGGDDDNPRDARLSNTTRDNVHVEGLETELCEDTREGSSALTKDVDNMEERVDHDLDSYLEKMMSCGLEFDKMKQLLACKDLLRSEESIRQRDDLGELEEDTLSGEIIDQVYMSVLEMLECALAGGHYRQAGQILQYLAKSSEKCRMEMTELHYQVLLPYEGGKTPTADQMSRGIEVAQRLTPLHCAACNPDTRHLERLILCGADIHIPDIVKRRPVHFAACCPDTGPLQLLLKHGAKPCDSIEDGDVPLHFAANANRQDNIEVLVQAAADSSDSDDPSVKRFGVAGLNKPNAESYTPLHTAVEAGALEAVRLLIEKGADVNIKLDESMEEVNPLMMAAQYGYFDIAVCLVEGKAQVEERDLYGRTAVIHAAMNGNTNVLSYLLNIGASPVSCDSSGNSPLHYAAAYGWYFCVKTLLQAGADVNVSNGWKITPVTIAYKKGHTGIVNTIVREAKEDINITEDIGSILLFAALSSPMSAELYVQVRYLVEDRGVVCTHTDAENRTALHHLAASNVYLGGSGKFPALSAVAMETTVQIARVLLDHGCDVRTVAEDDDTPAMTAMTMGNIALTELLVKAGCPVLTAQNSGGANLLNNLCSDHVLGKKDMLVILKYVASTDGSGGTQNLKQLFRDMAPVTNSDGATSLQTACLNYSICEERCDDSDTEEDKAAVRVLWQRGRELIKLLIDEFGADVNALYHEVREDQCWDLYSPLQLLLETQGCEYGGRRQEKEPEYPALRMILEYKPETNTRDRLGFTPLSSALRLDSSTALEILIKEGNADVTIPHMSEHGEEPLLICAIKRSGMKCIELLLEGGADVDAPDQPEGNSPLHCAVTCELKDGDTTVVVQMLLQRGANVNGVNKRKRTPLHGEVAVLASHLTLINETFDVLLMLLDHGADLAARDDQGRTPLHYVFASYELNEMPNNHDHVELCQILASRMKTEDLNIQDNLGMTALHYAAARGGNRCCMVLKQKGADVKLKNKDGHTPMVTAWFKGHTKCANIISQETQPGGQ